MSALGPIAAALVLILAVVVLVGLLDRAARARRDSVGRQVAVTDAIHSELGAIVAPTVQKRPGGVWQARIAVPFERPDAVERVVAIAHTTLARLDPARADDIRIVLVPQARPTRRRPTTDAIAGAPVTGSPGRGAPASLPKLGAQKAKAASGAAG